MKTKLGVILMAAVIAISSAQAQPPPVKIDCSFYHVDFSKKSGYSNAKVAPKDMAWLKPGGTAFFGPGPDFDPNHQSSTGYVVLGWGIGHLTASTDLRKTYRSVGAGGVRSPSECHQLSNVESRQPDAR